jgi:hypothetical protein
VGIIQDKLNVVNEISVFSSISEFGSFKKPTTNSLPSLNNKNEPIPFMLDILTTLIGSGSLDFILGKFFTEFADGIEPDIKTSIKSQTVVVTSDENIPTYFSNGFTIPVKNIDPYGKYKTNPNSDLGSTIYATGSFDLAAYNAISAPNSDVTFGNLYIKYNDSTDTFTFTPVNSLQTNGEFISSFIDNLTFINKKEFTTEILNEIFRIKTKTQNKSLKQIQSEQRLNILLDKLSKDEDLTISATDTNNINQELQDIKSGKNYIDLGCGLIENSITIDDLTSIANSVTGNTLQISNQFNNLFDTSFVNEGNTLDNKNVAKDNFFKRLIKAIENFLIKSVSLSPQILFLLFLVEALNNNGTADTNKTPEDQLSANKKLAKCFSETVREKFGEFIFNLIKTELLKIIKPAIALLIREKINNYLNVLRGLI